MITQCRACGSRDLGPVAATRRFVLCRDCALVQAAARPAPDRLFVHGAAPPQSPDRLAKARELATTLIAARGLDESSLVVDLGCGDGALLRCFAERAVPALGVEPARSAAGAARDGGLPILGAFFGRDVAAGIVAGGRRADLVLAVDALDRAADPDDFVAGIAALLADGGQVVLQFAWLRDAFEKGALAALPPDQLLCLSLTALDPIFARHGLHLNDASRETAGLRVTASHDNARSARLRAFLAAERALPIAPADAPRAATSRQAPKPLAADAAA